MAMKYIEIYLLSVPETIIVHQIRVITTKCAVTELFGGTGPKNPKKSDFIYVHSLRVRVIVIELHNIRVAIDFGKMN